ncbi:MAG TPA: protein kinase [Pseudonocardia sp.]|nr:protein kinase [Pseudonocardia sp.]
MSWFGEVDALTGEQFGPYRLEELIGRGGMGEVYRAYDTTRKRTVAVKRLPPNLAGDNEFQARFRREAEVVARLNEPHIIPIHDYGEIDGRLFIDMRLVVGTDLAGILEQNGPLPPARAVAIITQIASALAAAHSEGLIHRDVKPANVLISRTDRGEDFVHLVDFGIARPSGGTVLTATGSAIGTMDYMAPEQLVQGECDSRVDVYALGCVLFEALTATKPFPATSVPAQMYAHVHTDPPDLARFRPDLPAALGEVITRAMAKDPDRRYRTTTELADHANDALGGGQTAAAPNAPGGTWPLPPPTAHASVPTAQAPVPYGQPPAMAHQGGPPTYAPGGWPAPGQPAYYGPPPQVNQGGGPPVKRRRRGLVVSAVVALVAASAAIAAFVISHRGDGGTGSASGTSSSAASTDPAIPATGANPASGGQPAAGGKTVTPGGSPSSGVGEVTAVFEVTGTGRATNIDVDDGGQGAHLYYEALPFRKDSLVAADIGRLQLYATGATGCRITLNGKVVAQDSAAAKCVYTRPGQN